MRPVALRIMMVIGFAAASTAVLAHAVLVDSSPKDNATIKTAPKRVVLYFDARIEKPVTQVSLYLISRDRKSGPVKKKIALPKPSGGYRAGAADELIIPMPKLGPGSYQLEFQVLATDGHLSPGLMRFTISGKGKSP